MLFFASSVIVIVLLGGWQTGLIGLWSEGIAYVANRPERFETGGYAIQGDYSVSIDLTNLASNVGKELYNDGTYRIYVAWVDNTGSAFSGGYRIGFRSTGRYSLSGASLITGGQHVVTGGHSFSTNLSAKMTAQYNGKAYDCSVCGVGGLNYKDGDEFSFYMFPSKAYADHEVGLNEQGVVRLTVTNLYKNMWSKKV